MRIIIDDWLIDSDAMMRKPASWWSDTNRRVERRGCAFEIYLSKSVRDERIKKVTGKRSKL